MTLNDIALATGAPGGMDHALVARMNAPALAVDGAFTALRLLAK